MKIWITPQLIVLNSSIINNGRPNRNFDAFAYRS